MSEVENQKIVKCRMRGGVSSDDKCVQSFGVRLGLAGASIEGDNHDNEDRYRNSRVLPVLTVFCLTILNCTFRRFRVLSRPLPSPLNTSDLVPHVDVPSCVTTHHSEDSSDSSTSIDEAEPSCRDTQKCKPKSENFGLQGRMYFFLVCDGTP